MSDRMQAASIHRALAQEAPTPLGQLGAGSPADVPALGALVESEAVLRVADEAPIPTAQTLDLPNADLHTQRVGAFTSR
jgi:hypothetical protein